MRLILVILSYVLISGCISHYKGIQLSQLTINSKKANSLIVNRFPDYGDGHKDGCIVMLEMRLDLTIHDDGRVSGKISDVSTKLPLHNAQIQLTDDQNQRTKLISDSSGQFNALVSGRLIDLHIDYIGYRGFNIKL